MKFKNIPKIPKKFRTRSFEGRGFKPLLGFRKTKLLDFGLGPGVFNDHDRLRNFDAMQCNRNGNGYGTGHGNREWEWERQYISIGSCFRWLFLGGWRPCFWREMVDNKSAFSEEIFPLSLFFFFFLHVHSSYTDSHTHLYLY